MQKIVQIINASIKTYKMNDFEIRFVNKKIFISQIVKTRISNSFPNKDVIVKSARLADKSTTKI
ncbi:hypothetical protein BpHYR1_047862 [Brachionus plicatilis]|uniref:Uncharacterized protein n=1 Tax=Brachionus plicatilis TaxID=10195 RepID=A0A3M7PUH9_BRAPC|nr:hypothetical protein BpHYR1_047862 [Brachionus plicatilis]